MQQFNEPATAAPYRNVQIIVLCLVMGLTAFAVIAALMPPRQLGPNASGVDTLRLLAIIGAILAVPIAVLARRALLRLPSSTGQENNPYRSIAASATPPLLMRMSSPSNDAGMLST